MIIERNVKSDLKYVKTLLLENDLPMDDIDDEGIQDLYLLTTSAE